MKVEPGLRILTTKILIQKYTGNRGGNRNGRQQFSRINNRVNINARAPRRQKQLQSPIQYAARFQNYQPNFHQTTERFVSRRGRGGRQTWAQNTTHSNFVNPVRNVHRLNKLKMAKQRVQRARQHLIARRIATNIHPQNQGGRVSCSCMFIFHRKPELQIANVFVCVFLLMRTVHNSLLSLTCRRIMSLQLDVSWLVVLD